MNLTTSRRTFLTKQFLSEAEFKVTRQ